MVNKLLFIVALSCLANVGFGQLINFSGKVVSASNMAIPLANIKNLSEKNKVFHADSTGNFSFRLGVNSNLVISSVGYKDTTLTVTEDKATNLVITLSPAVNQLNAVAVESKRKATQFNQALSRAVAEGNLYFTQENGGMLGSRNDFSGLAGDEHSHTLIQTYNPGIGGRFVPNASLNEIHHKGDTKGSTYFFDNWVKGIIVDTAYHMINDNSNFYNYNKVTGDLVMTKDFASGLTIDPQIIQFFILSDSLKQNYTFVKAPVVSTNLFPTAVAMSDGYDIFKLTTTKFEKANFVTDGMTSHGNDYDEYTDKITYYLLDVDNNTSKPFVLKKKSLLEAFDNNPKAVSYLSAHKETIDDKYLSDLVASLK